MVTSLSIGTGATLDINDNALIVNYTGASPEAAIRAKIIEGRGGVGIGNGTWTGTGITSSAAAAANARIRSRGPSAMPTTAACPWARTPRSAASRWTPPRS